MGALFFLVATKPLMCPIILIVVLWLVAGLLPTLFIAPSEPSEKE